jgi:thiol-disulfide isomerase/thioredoxin
MKRLLPILLLSFASLAAFQVVRLPVADRLDVSAIEFVDQSGKSSTIADLRGKIVVVSFWTIWCPVCRQALPELLALQRNPKAKDVLVVIPCNCDTDNWPAGVKRFISANSKALQDFRYYRSQSGKCSASAILPERVSSFPTTIIVDRQGRLAVRWSGHSEGLILAEVNRLIDER